MSKIKNAKENINSINNIFKGKSETNNIINDLGKNVNIFNFSFEDVNKSNLLLNNFISNKNFIDEEFENKNNNSKSIILAPFNSSITEDEDNNFEISIIDNNCNELKIQNNIIKFTSKVKEINRIYELNNNGEIDNGVVGTGGV